MNSQLTIDDVQVHITEFLVETGKTHGHLRLQIVLKVNNTLWIAANELNVVITIKS